MFTTVFTIYKLPIIWGCSLSKVKVSGRIKNPASTVYNTAVAARLYQIATLLDSIIIH